jgi:hypothetical protein
MGKSNKKAVTHLEIHLVQCKNKEEEKLQSSNNIKYECTLNPNKATRTLPLSMDNHSKISSH